MTLCKSLYWVTKSKIPFTRVIQLLRLGKERFKVNVLKAH
jgi:hypothetical protein